MASQGIADVRTAVRPSVTLTRRIDASPERVYAAWTEPQTLIRWFGPSKARPGSVRAEIDPRVGGRYRISFNANDGEYFEVGGVYRVLEPPHRLVLSWAWHSTPERESQVTVTLWPDGTGTLLTLLHEQLFDQAAANGHTAGWTAALDGLQRHFST